MSSHGWRDSRPQRDFVDLTFHSGGHPWSLVEFTHNPLPYKSPLNTAETSKMEGKVCATQSAKIELYIV